MQVLDSFYRHKLNTPKSLLGLSISTFFLPFKTDCLGSSNYSSSVNSALWSYVLHPQSLKNHEAAIEK